MVDDLGVNGGLIKTPNNNRLVEIVGSKKIWINVQKKTSVKLIIK